MTRHFRASLRYLPDIDGYHPRFQPILIYVFARGIRISLFYSSLLFWDRIIVHLTSFHFASCIEKFKKKKYKDRQYLYMFIKLYSKAAILIKKMAD